MAVSGMPGTALRPSGKGVLVLLWLASVGRRCVALSATTSTMQEIERRRAVGIISHPDAGKTTMSEKLLLYGNAIQEAGAVRARAEQRKSRSDFLAMEKERGISISSTCLTFELEGTRINLLDTPGHSDFGEDTFRTLFACDNAVMLVDGGKGLEAQTRKLFGVARKSGLPVFTFVNKLDRPAKSPYEICDEITEEFGIECAIRTWPVGDGDRFKGVYRREDDVVLVYDAKASQAGDGAGTTKKGTRRAPTAIVPADDREALSAYLDEDLLDTLAEDREVIAELTPELDRSALLRGAQTAVYFGSAMTDVGVATFLEDFVAQGSRPMARKTLAASSSSSEKGEEDATGESFSGGLQEPESETFSAIVFKLQANLDKNHRDSMAYVRVVSGEFRRGLKCVHTRTGRTLTLSQASLLFGSSKDAVDVAYPGDVLGLPNPGNTLFQIGDALSVDAGLEFEPIPTFSPECFAYIRPAKVGASQKAFKKGLEQLLSEGAVQRLYPRGAEASGTGTADDAATGPLLAAVGRLQFDVVQDRLVNEYAVETTLEAVSYTIARWCQPDDPPAAWAALDKAKADGALAAVAVFQDLWARPVLLFRNEFTAARLQAELDLHPWALPPKQVQARGPGRKKK